MPSVLKIEEITETVEVFDITVEVDESFIVADAVLHNCPACAGLDRKRYKTGEPHPSLPIHHNCRCVLLPVTILSDLVEEQRPMARSDFMADAKRAYEEKYPKKKWEDLSESTRKKYYYQAMRDYERSTGQSAYTQVSGGMNFKEYFQNEMTDQQRRDWLGPKKFEIWKRGNLPLDSFIPPYPDRAMTVREMKRRDQESFASIPTPDKAKALLDFFKGKKSETQPQELTPHQLKRKEQLERARRNRAEREAHKIGANMIEGAHSIEDDLKATNPNFVAGRDGVWENNCQRCVVAYELRRRGIDVQAKPCDNDPLEEVKVKEHWKDLNGNAQWYDGAFPKGKDRQSFVESKMKNWGEGSRATVYVDWEDGTAHVFSAEMVNGKVVFVDPQTGEYNPRGNFPDQKTGTIMVTRVDNLKINDYIMEAVEVKK
jgi:hypothetical protein